MTKQDGLARRRPDWLYYNTIDRQLGTVNKHFYPQNRLKTLRLKNTREIIICSMIHNNGSKGLFSAKNMRGNLLTLLSKTEEFLHLKIALSGLRFQVEVNIFES